MIIYKVAFRHRDLGVRLNWYGSRKDANRRVAELRGDGDVEDGPIAVAEIKFPNGKANVLAWLNIHLATDNG